MDIISIENIKSNFGEKFPEGLYELIDIFFEKKDEKYFKTEKSIDKIKKIFYEKLESCEYFLKSPLFLIYMEYLIDNYINEQFIENNREKLYQYKSSELKEINGKINEKIKNLNANYEIFYDNALFCSGYSTLGNAFKSFFKFTLFYFEKFNNNIQLYLKIAENKELISRDSNQLEKDILSKIGADKIDELVKNMVGDGIKDFKERFKLIQAECERLTGDIDCKQKQMIDNINSETCKMQRKINQHAKKSDPLYQASILGIFITMILSVIGGLKLVELIPSLFDDKHHNKSISFLLLGISIIIIFEILFFLADLFQNNTREKDIEENNNKSSNIKKRNFVYILAIIIFIFSIISFFGYY